MRMKRRINEIKWMKRKAEKKRGREREKRRGREEEKSEDTKKK